MYTSHGLVQYICVNVYVCTHIHISISYLIVYYVYAKADNR